MPRRPRRPRSSTAAAVLLAATVIAGSATPTAGEPAPPRWPAATGGTLQRPAPPIPPRVPPRGGRLAGNDVLLIVLDAARADAIGAWGADRPTPAIDRLVSSGTRVERALSNSAWTAPAIASLWTGLHPHTHGVDDWNAPLPTAVSRLPEAFRQAGYATQLWSSHTLYRANRTMREGFERTHLLRVAERDWLPAGPTLGRDERPRFNLVHLLVPHGPYEPPPPFAGRYARDVDDIDVGAPALRTLSRRPGITREHPTVRAARDRYDEMVAWADAQVGRVLTALADSGRADRTLVVLVSDHGEAFLEHGLMLHTRDLHDEMARVPMAFRWPPSAGLDHRATVPGPASLVDVTATLVDLFGLRWGHRIHGRSLAAIALGEPRAPASDPPIVFAMARGVRQEGAGRRPEWLLLERGEHKVIVDAHSDRVRLYRPRRDPGERHDLVASDPGVAAELARLARDQRRADRGLGRRIDARSGAVPPAGETDG